MMRSIRWLRALISWLAEPRLLWLGLVVLTALLAFPLIGGAVEREIRASGLALQVFGLGTVAYGLRETRRLFGRPPMRLELRQWLARFPKRRQHVVTASATATGRGRAQARAHMWTRMGPGTSQAELLQAVTENLERLNQRLLRVEGESDARDRVFARAIEQEREIRSKGDAEVHAKLEAAETGGIHISLVGLVWLLAGLLMSTLSSEIAHWMG